MFKKFLGLFQRVSRATPSASLERSRPATHAATIKFRWCISSPNCHRVTNNGFIAVITRRQANRYANHQAELEATAAPTAAGPAQCTVKRFATRPAKRTSWQSSELCFLIMLSAITTPAVDDEMEEDGKGHLLSNGVFLVVCCFFQRTIFLFELVESFGAGSPIQHCQRCCLMS